MDVQLGVIGLPQLADALRSIGVNVVGGSRVFRESGIQVADASHSGLFPDGVFPLLLCQPAGDVVPGFAAFVDKYAQATPIGIVVPSAGSAIGHEYAVTFEMPLTVREVVTQFAQVLPASVVESVLTAPFADVALDVDSGDLPAGWDAPKVAPVVAGGNPWERFANKNVTPTPVVPSTPVAPVAPIAPVEYVQHDSVWSNDEDVPAAPPVVETAPPVSGLPAWMTTSPDAHNTPTMQASGGGFPPVSAAPVQDTAAHRTSTPDGADTDEFARPSWLNGGTPPQPAPVLAPQYREPEPVVDGHRTDFLFTPVTTPAPAPAPYTPTPVVERPSEPAFTSWSAPTHTLAEPEPEPFTVPATVDMARTTKAHIIIVFSGSGGVNKTTTSRNLAERAAVVSEQAGTPWRTLLVDANEGQGDQRTFLRLPADTHLPSIMDYATGAISARDTIIPAHTVNEHRPRILADKNPFHYALVLAPPADIRNPHLLSGKHYLDVVREAQDHADLIVIDTQSLEANATDYADMVQTLFLPLMRSGAIGLGVSRYEDTGAKNLALQLDTFIREGIPATQLRSLLTAYPSSNSAPLDTLLPSLAKPFAQRGRLVGGTYQSDEVFGLINGGAIAHDHPHVAPALDALLYDVTGEEMFAPKQREAVKSSRFSNLFKSKGARR